MKEIKREQPNPQVQSCSVTPQKGLHLKSIMLGNEIVSVLIDTGSTVTLIREDVRSKIVDHSRLSKINTVLYGLGQTEVITKGSFEYDFVLDKAQYSLTWHVVPNKQLNFEAIIGTDILGQALNSSEYASPIVLVKNKKTYNKKRKKAPEYQVDDLIAVQRTQFGGGLKLRLKFFGRTISNY
ncbi:homeotic protein female sterile [Trichonephila clavipes]|nr:homeotic protein female sterile [Trichonephila clavipes]